jgi:hypothetical protein
MGGRQLGVRVEVEVAHPDGDCRVDGRQQLADDSSMLGARACELRVDAHPDDL